MEIKQFLKQRLLLLYPDPVVPESELYQELKEKVLENTSVRIYIIGTFIFTVPFFRYVFGLDINVLACEALLVTILFYTLLSFPIFKKDFFKDSSSLSLFYLCYLILDVLFISSSFIFSKFGSFMYVLPVYYIFFGYLVFPKYWQSLVIFFVSSFSVALAHLVAYFNWFQIRSSMPGQEMPFLRDSNFVIATVGSIIVIYYFFALMCSLSARRLKAETQGLRVANDQINAKSGQLQARIDELEKFQKITEGRELKMVALKDELEKLKAHLAETGQSNN